MDPFSVFSRPVIHLIITLIGKLDEQAFAPLIPHNGKNICFHVHNLTPLYFTIQTQGLHPISEPQSVDITFSGPLFEFINMIFSHYYSIAKLEVNGDLHCAQALYACWNHLDLDWEGQCSKILGPEIAYGLGQTLRYGKKWVTQTYKARCEDIIAYLQDEKKLLPTLQEVEALFSQIDILRHDVERFEAQLRLLTQREKNTTKGIQCA